MAVRVRPPGLLGDSGNESMLSVVKVARPCLLAACPGSRDAVSLDSCFSTSPPVLSRQPAARVYKAAPLRCLARAWP